MTEQTTSLELRTDLSRQLREGATAFKLGGYDPYPFQRQYHACYEGRFTSPHQGPKESGVPAKQILDSAANQVGKTTVGGTDIAIHALGDYPKWWGHDWPNLTELLREYPEIWTGGENNDRVRDIMQSDLMGEAADPSKLGSGWIPKDRIVSMVKKSGVPNALDSVTVRHKAGFNVTIKFKAYSADLLDWAGTPVALIHLDEEPPRAYYSQSLARTISTRGYVKMTFTPEKGATELVSAFSTNLKPGQCFLISGWDDAKHPDGRTHLDPEHLEALLAAFLPHERDMRSKGIPILGAGMVFPVALDKIVIDPQMLPLYARRICGMDFGSGGVNHPTAAAWWAFDFDAKIAYLYACYKSLETSLGIHATAVRAKGPWIPVAWPHDGHRKEAYATEGIANAYRAAGVNMRHTHFADPDTGTNAVQPGITAMYQAMEGTSPDWTIKIFNTCHEYLQEHQMYHRSEKDSSIVPVNDDVISAARIGFRSARYARQEEFHRQVHVPGVAEGAGTWNPTQGM
ncbi:hypothetical protein LCGC14_1135410 [marine sediment metagenome]|uniref:Uncharacterized protein n=1 Tax=marine sediment metagenome TaxID=412755 RepID=A0A0F9M4Q9_9ZZZZ